MAVDSNIGSLPDLSQIQDDVLFVAESQGVACKMTGAQLKALARGIVKVERTDGTGEAGSLDTYTITYTDNTTSTYTVQNGADGNAAVDATAVWFSTGDLDGILFDGLYFRSLYGSAAKPTSKTVKEGDYVILIPDGNLLRITSIFNAACLVEDTGNVIGTAGNKPRWWHSSKAGASLSNNIIALSELTGPVTPTDRTVLRGDIIVSDADKSIVYVRYTQQDSGGTWRAYLTDIRGQLP